MRSAIGATTLISPDMGSTRPGATACHCFSSAGLARNADEVPSACSSRPEPAMEQAISRPREIANSSIFKAAKNSTFDLASLREPRTFSLFANDMAIFHVNNPIGERQYTRIMRDDQHRATRLFRNVGQNAHDARPFSLSKEAVGSSARMTAASPAMARAMATRCCSPPLSSRGKDLSL